MESSEEEIIMLRMCCSAASAVLIGIVVMLRQMLEDARRDYNNVPREPSQMRDLNRNVHMYRILSGDANSCLEHLRMRRGPFLNLATLMRDGGLLKDTIHVPVEEQLAMFLHIVGNKSKNRVMSTDFIRSGETVSRYFNKVLGAISCLRDRFMKQAPSETPAEVRESTLFYPFFMDCIGLVDGIHIDAMVPTKYVVRFRGRKGVTQNVLAAATPDKRFTYVMAGWEGSASDFRILKDALSLPHPHGLRVYEGKYYLCDAGYTTMPGFISPYRGVPYHLKESSSRMPNNRKELFNLRHSALRMEIEAAFCILKNRFKILSARPNYPLPSQVDIVLACTVLHNYIAIADPVDKYLNEEMGIIHEEGDIMDEDDDEVVDFSETLTQQEQVEAREEWKMKRDQIAWDMWVDYCGKYRWGDTSEVGMD
ncbi:uncharacterized protein LOC109848413 isoform X2 [Asparagus officinalis]|uniref:uncharacterized protein LOC109848413 isoform X2 n=1 Tax=Asparagus officinalis TaxID=4686 RepID=UPI00098E1CF9|nr:uncharacterized protein LOC109848413 isoform X2 [Asparagus officinalis]